MKKNTFELWGRPKHIVCNISMYSYQFLNILVFLWTTGLLYPKSCERQTFLVLQYLVRTRYDFSELQVVGHDICLWGFSWSFFITSFCVSYGAPQPAQTNPCTSAIGYALRLHNWKPFWGTHLLEYGIGRDFGALKGSRRLFSAGRVVVAVCYAFVSAWVRLTYKRLFEYKTTTRLVLLMVLRICMFVGDDVLMIVECSKESYQRRRALGGNLLPCHLEVSLAEICYCCTCCTDGRYFERYVQRICAVNGIRYQTIQRVSSAERRYHWR